MSDALIGHSGFVGSTLQQQRRFEALFRSTDMEKSSSGRFETTVCAGAPAQKWLANKHPKEDRENIQMLIDHLGRLKTKFFILISTVDVFPVPIAVNEESSIDATNNHAYGINRFYLETFVQQQFSNHLIVRLPGLVGPGLKKNIIYDLVHKHHTSQIDTRSQFQFYPMVNLWKDITVAQSLGVKTIHLMAEPISVADLAIEAFEMRLRNETMRQPPRYDVRSLYARAFNNDEHYQYDRQDTIDAVKAYQKTVVLSPTHNSQGAA